ncbi:MAG: molybdenum cofactor biosynthesis protein B [Myxococcota bacterium]|jgi:molybdenum cofactor biosynthesis protein B
MTEKQQSTVVAVRIAVLTVSDSRTFETDTSGGYLAKALVDAGHHLTSRKLLSDDLDLVKGQLIEWCDDPRIDVIITTGGTGLTGRDITADVVESLYLKAIPGFGELFRMLSYQEIGSSTIQSRATGGLARNHTLIFALPGSTGACRLGWEQILAKQLNVDQRPCNLVTLMPRFKEV